ncbi:MAG: hypothetical protein DM484_03145 [Candidatus Methylumidiphilus alinenensis]|uniref:PEP-CTERM protein-sorting domain-containing protein n=1 Tax=Candidatus Methylumidiphilus alinenensis TaxID=2202197 RepID=A0A2W4RRZ4_9GAMM|nr:MAG: hypothetical protein DM484_03145 [Candidatus Methylumidiphilus alinenensis]
MNKKPLIPLFLTLGFAAGSASADTIVYDNGPINGTINAYNIYFGFAITDSFTLSSNASVHDFDNLGLWVYPGAQPTSVDFLITTAAFGGITVDSGTAALSSVQVGTGFGYYPIYSSSFNIPSLPLSAGTYWLQLQNAVTTNGSHVYWDINYGPSTAYLQPYGYGTYAIGSESFQVTATPTPIPAALWLVGSGLAGVFGFARRKAGKDTQA